MSNRMAVQLGMKVFTKGEYNRQRIRNSRNIWLQPKRNLSARLAARTSMRGASTSTFKCLGIRLRREIRNYRNVH